MALVSGGRSTLNPNAPLYIPASIRQVEDFSPEWWNLVTTSTWFHAYWLSQHQGEDFFGYEEDSFGEADVVDLLPDTIDLGMDEEDIYMEAQEFLRSSETGQEYIPSFPTEKGVPASGYSMDSGAVFKSRTGESIKILTENLSILEKLIEGSLPVEKGQKYTVPVEKGQKYTAEQTKFLEKPAKHISPKCSPRRIQQPR